jgi:adenylate cyclase class IV
MDGLVARHYKEKGMEALFTTTMPMYSKTKSTTIAGGINKPLLVKDLRHKFIPVEIQGKKCYRHVTTIPEDHAEVEVIKTHQNFPTMLVVEVFRTINELSLKPLAILQERKKVVYVIQREYQKVENEIKIFVDDIPGMLMRLRELVKYSHTEYLRDVIYGIKEEKKKIRLRLCDNFEHTHIEATHKYKTTADDGDVKKEIEEIIYKGSRLDDALAMIRLQGEFEEENSYEKIRIVFEDDGDTIITVDVYPFGCWLEIEGGIERIHALAKKLGFTTKDYINESADDLYLKWIQMHNLPEMWDVRFGLTGKK